MPSGIMSKIGRALSVFGVSSPEDIAAQKRATASRKQAKEPANPSANPCEQTTTEKTTIKPTEPS